MTDTADRSDMCVTVLPDCTALLSRTHKSSPLSEPLSPRTTNNPIPHPVTILSQVSWQSPLLCTLQTALCGVAYPVRRRMDTINPWQKLHVALPVGRRDAVIQFSTYWESHLRLSGWYFERQLHYRGLPDVSLLPTMLPEIHVLCIFTWKILFLFCTVQYTVYITCNELELYTGYS
jgi:hypothetical protein